MAADNPYRDLDQAMLGEIYASTEPMENLYVLCDECGSRFGGTPGAEQAANFIRQKLTEYGLDDPHLEAYEYQGWERAVAALTMTEPIERDIPCISLPYSQPSDVIGKLVYVAEGTPAMFAAAKDEIPGNIVMATTRSPAGHRHMHRAEKYSRAMLMGAKGFMWMQSAESLGPETGSVGWNHEALIPGVSVAMEWGEFLLRTIRRKGDVTLRMQTNDVLRPMTAWNVVGDIRGRTHPDEYVIFLCHYDGHDISQGARDPASGTVVVLEMGRVLAKHARGRLNRTVRLLLTSNEEVGLFGTYDFIEKHRTELPRIRFAMNLDSAGGGAGRKGVVLNEWPDLEPLFRGIATETGADIPVGQGLSAFSDHFPFFQAGVPSASMGDPSPRDPGPRLRGIGHTHWDTADKVHLPNIQAAAAAAVRMAVRVANIPGWPAQHRDRAVVEKLLATSPSFEQYRLMQQLVERHGPDIINWWFPRP